MDATLEFGQPASIGFGGSNGGNMGGTGPNQQTGGGATAVDSRTDAVAGVDANGSRVLVFPELPTSNGMSATAIVGGGQRFGPGFGPACLVGQFAVVGYNNTNTSGLFAPTASNLCFPAGATFDAQGNLWVADSGNARALRYSPNAKQHRFIGQLTANLVIGQPGFNSSAPAVTANGMFQPQDIHFDPRGNLWVADTANGRMLRYSPPFSNGMAADMVIGQRGFNSTTVAAGPNSGVSGVTCVTDQSTLCSPIAFGFDATGNLYVSDFDQCRVLIFNAPLSSGMPATVVIGQPDFTSTQIVKPPNVNGTGYYFTAGIAVN
jgi:hypothetical protein